MNNKTENWIAEIRLWSQTASEPQAEYSCLVSGYKHNSTFCMRAIPEISQLLQRSYYVVWIEFILSATGGRASSNLEKKLLPFRAMQKWIEQFLHTDRPSANKEYRLRKKIVKQLKT